MNFIQYIITFLVITFITSFTLKRIFNTHILINKRVYEINKNNGKTGNENNNFESTVIVKFRNWINGIPKMNSKKQKALTILINKAGKPFNVKTNEIIALQIIGSIASGSFLFLVVYSSSNKLSSSFFLSFLFTLLIYNMPIFLLKRKITNRTKLIEKGMSDFFDLVNVSVEAGTGLDNAIMKVSKEIKGPLSDEFLEALNDMKLGKTKKEAFTHLKEKIEVESFKNVMSSIIHAEQMGVSISKTLKEQTISIREQQLEKGKEKAMKAPVKMLIPLVLFIFPTLFIILIGPVVLQYFYK